MQTAPVVVSQQSNAPSLHRSSPTVNAEQDVGVLSYLLYRAFGPHDRALDSNVNSRPPILPPDKINAPIRSTTTPLKKTRRAKASGRSQNQNQSQQPSSLPQAPPRTKQSFDYFLVLDIEATCMQGKDMNWCNEIIEFPVVLLKWKDKTQDGKANQLVVVDEFHTYVRPTYRPVLTDFCKALTGIMQHDVDAAPEFADVLVQLKAWLVKHELIHERTNKPLRRFMWCTDGPFDIRDFIVKQCFISQVKLPDWLRTDIMDVRRVVSNWALAPDDQRYPRTAGAAALLSDSFHKPPLHYRRPSLNLVSQLQALSLAPFQGREHSGIDDSRNIARIVTELGRIGIRLESNTMIDPGRKWYWMGSRPGEIYDDYL